MIAQLSIQGNLNFESTAPKALLGADLRRSSAANGLRGGVYNNVQSELPASHLVFLLVLPKHPLSHSIETPGHFMESF